LIRMNYTVVGNEGGLSYFTQGGWVEYGYGPQDYTTKIYENWLSLPILAKFTPILNKSFSLGILAKLPEPSVPCLDLVFRERLVT